VPVTQIVGQKVENLHKCSSDGSVVSDVVRVTLLVFIVARIPIVYADETYIHTSHTSTLRLP
jgi:hypothetical protein